MLLQATCGGVHVLHACKMSFGHHNTELWVLVALNDGARISDVQHQLMQLRHCGCLVLRGHGFVDCDKHLVTGFSFGAGACEDANIPHFIFAYVPDYLTDNLILEVGGGLSARTR